VPGEHRSWANLGGGRPKVAIAMATFDPPADLFERQIESIRAQTHEEWTCLISDDASPADGQDLLERLVGDDPRFVVERHSKRLGYYRNFERALEMVPAEAGLVALSDQDDQWHPDKLATLVAAVTDGVTLAYSDTRVVDEQGRTLSETFWTERAHNEDDLGALLLVNSITGGAALFRSEILSCVLPFPPQAETVLHDHWVGMVAMSLGDVAYVDRPLYDYVQHGTAVLGHESLRRPRRGRKGLAKLAALRSGSEFRRIASLRFDWARRGYPVVLAVETSATLLLMRAGDDISRRKRRILRRYARLERSPLTWLRLLVHAHLGRAKTLGSERFLVAGSLWRVTSSAVKRLRLPPPSPRAQAFSDWLKPPLSPNEPTDDEQVELR
jgi:glycosyltransferase involved in cell wall biosynthesis